MPTYKNIMVPVMKWDPNKVNKKGSKGAMKATGKKRKQRVQVLKNGKYKFVKNSSKGSTTKKKASGGSKGGSKKKKTKSKGSTTTTKGNGGKKNMTSRLSPFNKNGLKVVTAGLLVALIAPMFDSRREKGASPAKQISQGRVGSGIQDYFDILKSPNRPYRKIGIGAVGVAVGSRVTGVKSISFAQFS